MSKIEWTDRTWNPITGCSKISEGCKNCYAEVMTSRLCAMGVKKYENGFDKVTFHEDALEEPLKWKKPSRIFVCSMSDLFHEGVPFEKLEKVFNIMHAADWHTFLLLTKRPERMGKFLSWYYGADLRPVSHIWLGVTVENQEQADKRIPYLLATPAAKRFVSVEPLIDCIDLKYVLIKKSDAPERGKPDVTIDALKGWFGGFYNERTKLDWVIVGGESGPNARPMKKEWVLNIKRQCDEQGVQFFFKQWGTYGEDGVKRNKKANGHLIDGKEYQAMPEVRS